MKATTWLCSCKAAVWYLGLLSYSVGMPHIEVVIALVTLPIACTCFCAAMFWSIALSLHARCHRSEPTMQDHALLTLHYDSSLVNEPCRLIVL